MFSHAVSMGKEEIESAGVRRAPVIREAQILLQLASSVRGGERYSDIRIREAEAIPFNCGRRCELRRIVWSSIEKRFPPQASEGDHGNMLVPSHRKHVTLGTAVCSIVADHE